MPVSYNLKKSFLLTGLLENGTTVCSLLDPINWIAATCMSFYLTADKRYPLISVIQGPTIFGNKKGLKVQS